MMEGRKIKKNKMRRLVKSRKSKEQLKKEWQIMVN